MAGLTPIHWKDFERVLLYAGCLFIREKGDHRIYTRSDLKRPVVIPKTTQIPVFVIRNNLRILGISVAEYLEILRNI